MPRIKNYAQDTAVTAADTVIGTDESGNTVTFTMQQIADFSNNDGSTSNYKHHQNSAATTWTITHNLDLVDYLPHVNIKLSGGGTYNNVQAMGIVTYVTKDQLTISLADAQSGYAYILK
jgi:hypothetical protein|tara:strand:+ start:365 stop:721 length:357 start_codon:yes stop_codon:yes gene_type:complete